MAGKDETVAPHEMELDAKYDNYDYPIIAPVPQNGHPGHLTSQQQAQVHQFRMMLEQKGYKKRLDTLTLVLTAPCSPSRAHDQG